MELWVTHGSCLDVLVFFWEQSSIKNKVSLEEKLKNLRSRAAELAVHDWDYKSRPFPLAEKSQDCEVPAKAGYPLCAGDRVQGRGPQAVR